MFVDALATNLFLADVFYMFRESTLPGQVIVVLLFAGSIYAWSIMVTKYLALKQAERETQGFLLAYRREAHPIALYLKRQKYPNTPLFKIYENGSLALGGELESTGVNTQELFMSGLGDDGHRITQLQMSAIRSNSERSVADQALVLESHMGVLATAVSASPFLGLLGTVWGVMDAFSDMAVVGSASLSTVAPGIAGALLTTVVGLLVALPSAIGYNLLAGKIKRLTVAMDNFAQEFEAAVQRTFVIDTQ